MSVFGFFAFSQQPVNGQLSDLPNDVRHSPLVEQSLLELPSIGFVPEKQPVRQALTIQSQANYAFTDDVTETEYRGSSRMVVIHASNESAWEATPLLAEEFVEE